MSPKPFGTVLSMGAMLMSAILWSCPQGSFPRKCLRGQGQRRSWIAGQSSGSLVIISEHPAPLFHAVKDQHLGLQGTPGGGGGRAALCLHCGESEISETSHSRIGQVYESPLAPADPAAGRSCPLRAWPDITLCLVLPFPTLLPLFPLQSSLGVLPENIVCSSIPNLGSSAGGADLRQLHPQKARLAGEGPA